MISTAMNTLCDASSAPFEQAINLRNAVNRDGSWGQALSARGLFIAQILISIVAIPFALFALIFAPPLALVTEGKDQAFALAKDLGETILGHACFIPTSFISAFAPHSLEWSAPLKQALEFFVPSHT